MKRTACSAVFLTLLFALSPALAEEEPLHAGLDSVAPPFASPTMDGGVEGLTVDTANTIAERLGRKLTLEPTQFSGLIPALQAGTYDFIAAGVTVTEERAENLLFTEGLWNTDYQFLLRADAPQIKSLSDLKGKTIAVNKGTVYDKWAREKAAEVGWSIESYASNNDASQAVLSGRAAAALLGDSQAMWLPTQNPALKASEYRFVTGLVFSYAFRKDQAEFRKQVENVLECMKLDGTTAKLYEKWMGAAPAADTATAKVFPGYGVPGLPGYDPTEHTPSCAK